MAILIPYPLDHSCEMCGCSCMAQLVGPLSDAEVDRVSRAHRAFAQTDTMPPGLNPIMKGIKPDGSCLYFLNFPQKKCCFLDENARCRIHAEFDATHKPAACRRFPLIAIRAQDDIRIAVKPYCYANYRVCSLEPAAPGFADACMQDPVMRPILDDLIDNAARRLPVQSPDPAAQALALEQERELIAWLGRENISAADLFPALVTGCRRPRAELPEPFLRDVARAFERIVPAVSQIADALGSSAHAKHVLRLCRALSDPVRPQALAGDAPLWRFARHALHNAVFLRETTRFPDLSIGCFALALGALLASSAQNGDAVTPDAAHIFTAWMRIMAQSKLFEALFPTPKSFVELTRNLDV